MRKILILAAAVFAFCGCNDKEENQPFAGIDNHITSFALTAKEDVYKRQHRSNAFYPGRSLPIRKFYALPIARPGDFFL